MEKSPLERLKELLPNLEGKLYTADLDAVKEVVKKASDPSYEFRERFLKMTADYLMNNAFEQELYRGNIESRDLMIKAVGIIRAL